MLEMTDALKQTLPTCASRNIRKQCGEDTFRYWSPRVGEHVSFFSHGSFQTTCQRSYSLGSTVNEGITYISLFLEL